MDKSKKPLPIYKAEFEESDDNETGLTAIGIVDSPAIMIDFQKFQKQEEIFVQKFATTNVDKRLCVGVAMVSGMRIYRNDPENGEYYVYFDAETIRKMVYSYFKKGAINNFNLNHDPNKKTTAVYMVESWFTEDNSKEKNYGINVPNGSWCITCKIDDSEEGNLIWNEYLKSGELKGFSIECYVPYIKVLNKLNLPIEENTIENVLKEITIDDVLNEIKEILKK